MESKRGVCRLGRWRFSADPEGVDGGSRGYEGVGGCSSHASLGLLIT